MPESKIDKAAKTATDHSVAEVVHAQVKPGGRVVHANKSYGERGTVQIERSRLGELAGDFDVLEDGAAVPDVAGR